MTAIDMGLEIIKGAKDVFTTMLMVDLQAENIARNEKVPITSNLTSMIGLGGAMKGVLAVHCPAETAQKITGSFLGIEVTEIDEDVKDAIGEIANMLAGNLKVSCADAAINVELAIPTSIVGDGFVVSSMAEADRLVVSMLMDESPFWVELQYVLVT